MAILPSEIHFRYVNNSGTIAPGKVGNLFIDDAVNGPTTYALVEVHNRSALALSAGKAWLTLDPGGAAVAIAIANGTAVPENDYYDPIGPEGLTYTTPTTQATGLVLPTLDAGTKCLLSIRRVLTGAATAFPETNRLNVAGTSPL